MSLQNWYPSHRVPTVHVYPHKVVCESLYCLLAYRASFQEALFVSAVGEGSDGQFALLWPEVLDQGSKSQWHSSHTRRQSKVGKWLFDPWTTVWPARSLQQDISHQAVLTHMCMSKSLNIILAIRADFPRKLWSLHFACPLSSSAWLKSQSMSHCGLLIKNTIKDASWYTQRQVCADKKRIYRLQSLATTVMRMVDSLVKRTDTKVSDSGRLLESFLKAAADDRGEWELPLAPEKLSALEKVIIQLLLTASRSFLVSLNFTFTSHSRLSRSRNSTPGWRNPD